MRVRRVEGAEQLPKEDETKQRQGNCGSHSHLHSISKRGAKVSRNCAIIIIAMLDLCHYTMFTVLSDDSVRDVIVVFNILSMLIAVPGNIITIIVIGRVRKLRREPTYLLIGSVCLADTLVSTLTQPMYISLVILDSGDKYCIYYKLFFVIGWISAFGSVVGINMITIDRFIYIVYPLKYDGYMTRKRAVLMIIVTWIMVLIFGVVPLAWHNSIVLHTALFCHNSVSCILCAITYHRIYVKVRKSNSQRPILRSESSKGNTSMQRQATRTVFIVVLLFVGCWGPWTIQSFIMAIKEAIVDDIEAEYYDKTFRIIQTFFLTVGFSGSAANVFVYTFKNGNLRKEWIRFICGFVKRRRYSINSKEGSLRRKISQMSVQLQSLAGNRQVEPP